MASNRLLDTGAVPPFNEARRDRLADAAIEILARDGAKGLTHRAVDAEAGEPVGTTSRYFRSRDALMHGAADRARALHFSDLGRPAKSPADHLADMVHSALTQNRSRHLAMLELFLESNRRPGLRAALAETRAAQIQLIRRMHKAAGINLTTHQATTLVATITGLVFMGLTTPDAIGLRSADDARRMVRGMIGPC